MELQDSLSRLENTETFDADINRALEQQLNEKENLLEAEMQHTQSALTKVDNLTRILQDTENEKKDALLNIARLTRELDNKIAMCATLERKERESHSALVAVQSTFHDSADVAFMKASMDAQEASVSQMFKKMQITEKIACDLQIAIDMLDVDSDEFVNVIDTVKHIEKDYWSQWRKITKLWLEK